MDTARFESTDPHGRGWGATLEGRQAVHVAHDLASVPAVLAEAEAAARAGLWAAVAVAYDAAPAFEAAMSTAGIETGLPLAWVGVYARASDPAKAPPGADTPGLALHPAVASPAYVAGVRAAQEHIRAGDTYQVNLTFPLTAPAPLDPAALFDRLRATQQAAYCAHLDLGRHEILSLSPELFFERRGGRLTTRPMKGTTRRGRWWEEDEALAAHLQSSPKTRAENVMIVDLLRNDIGRVAATGSVQVPALFTLERYPTLWQLTSTVTAEIAGSVSLVDLFRALFPCGSVTGAPKIRTMAIIGALEGAPRGLYTGAIGLIQPGGDCTFSVAIRTIVVDHENRTATMGVGAGITAESDPADEYRECLLKAAFAADTVTSTERARTFSLLETMRLESGVVHREERHIARMRASAQYFGLVWDEPRVRHCVDTERAAHHDGCWRLRLTMDHTGRPAATCTPHTDATRPWRVALADTPIDSQDPFRFNKTTSRRVYDAARAQHPLMDDVLLWNERDEITESTIANIVLEIDGQRVTPPVSCGLLPGVLRAELLERGEIEERVVTRRDLARATRVWLVNSLRGWIAVTVE